MPIAQEGAIVEGLGIVSFASGENAFTMSPNGRYIAFRATLADGSEAALRLEVQGPPPVPDGGHVPGTQMRAATSATGAGIDISWDAASCPAGQYNLFYGSLAAISDLTYSGAVCGLGQTGQATFDPPGGSLFFLIASADELGVEGAHGYDSRGRARHASAQQQCGVFGQIRSARCSQTMAGHAPGSEAPKEVVGRH